MCVWGCAHLANFYVLKWLGRALITAAFYRVYRWEFDCIATASRALWWAAVKFYICLAASRDRFAEFNCWTRCNRVRAKRLDEILFDRGFNVFPTILIFITSKSTRKFSSCPSFKRNYRHLIKARAFTFVLFINAFGRRRCQKYWITRPFGRALFCLPRTLFLPECDKARHNARLENGQHSLTLRRVLISAWL